MQKKRRGMERRVYTSNEEWIAICIKDLVSYHGVSLNTWKDKDQQKDDERGRELSTYMKNIYQQEQTGNKLDYYPFVVVAVEMLSPQEEEKPGSGEKEVDVNKQRFPRVLPNWDQSHRVQIGCLIFYLYFDERLTPLMIAVNISSDQKRHSRKEGQVGMMVEVDGVERGG